MNTALYHNGDPGMALDLDLGPDTDLDRDQSLEQSYDNGRLSPLFSFLFDKIVSLNFEGENRLFFFQQVGFGSGPRERE